MRMLNWLCGILVALAMIPFFGVVALFVVSVFLFVFFCVMVAAVTGNLQMTFTDKDW